MNSAQRNRFLWVAVSVPVILFVMISAWKVENNVSGSTGEPAGATPTAIANLHPWLNSFISLFVPFLAGDQNATATSTPTQTATFSVTHPSPSQASTVSLTPTRTFPYTLTPTRSSIFTSTPTNKAPSQTPTFSTPVIQNWTPTPTLSPVSANILETFEGPINTWQVASLVAGSGAISQSPDHPAAGSSSARLDSMGSGSSASLGAMNFIDRASDHSWGERPGKWFWQRASVYLPAQTISALNLSGYLDLAGFWPSAGGTYGWWLRVRQDKNGNATLSIYGYDLAGKPAEFNIYGTFPTDQWVDFTIGFNSQAGPGVKRAFAVLINGNFYGWYHQGHMDTETYDRAAIGIIHTNSTAPLSVYVDQWVSPQTQALPVGPDLRSTASLQNQDFRNQSGVQWQIDWSTWENNLVLDPIHGLFSSTFRVQSGHNLDRMPDLSSGWAQIEIDWTNGTPPGNASLNGAFAGLVGFHKEINREQNLEVSPMIVNGTAKLIYDAWTGGETDLASWTLPQASTLSDGRNIPEPGDIIRVRWEQVSSTQINLRASYYDASTNTWYNNVINDTHDLSGVGSKDSSLPGNVNFLDGFHTASSITIDTPFYSIRNYTVGALATYPGP